MKTHALPSVETLRDLLIYDAVTGFLRWKERPAKYFADGRCCAQGNANNWNAYNAGKQAFFGVNKAGYHYGTIFGVQYLAHRVAWKWLAREEPELIDHINGDRGDNRWSNLCSTNQPENARNTGFSSRNSSGVTGVHRNKGCSTWSATIGQRRLGSFATIEAATAARREAEIALGFNESHGRRACWGNISSEALAARAQFRALLMEAHLWPPLLADRAFMEEWARREKRFRRLFLLAEDAL